MSPSPELLAAVTGSHTAIRRAEVRSPAGALITEIPVTDGNITGTYGQAARWKCDLQIPARADLIPREPGDLLHPLTGNELWLSAGARLSGSLTPDGTEEWVPWGKYPITQAPVDRDGNGTTLALHGEDRSENIDSQEWVYPYQSLSGDAAPSVADVLNNRRPGFEHDLSDLHAVVNSQVFDKSKPWQDVVKLVRDTGHDLALDLDGVARARAVPDPAGAAPYRSYGPNDLRLVKKISRTLTREGVHTGVVVWAQNPGNSDVYFYVVWDLNPASPTFAGGPLGYRPRRIDSSAIGNQATAQQAGDAELRRLRGSGDGYQLTLPVDPTMDVARIISAPFDAASRAETGFVQQVIFPWRVEGDMTVDARTTMPTDPT